MSLFLDERLLEQATRVLGARSSSDAVNIALKEVIRLKKVQQVAGFVGSGIWQGNLEDMREDRPVSRDRRPRRLN